MRNLAEVHQAKLEDDTGQMKLWHKRLGHLQLIQAVNRSLIKGVNVTKTGKLDVCEGCVKGKTSLKPFKSIVQRDKVNPEVATDA